MAISKKKISENAEYWNARAAGYSDVNKWELAGESRTLWKAVLKDCISGHFPDRPAGEIRVLDVGCGPGFFAVILTELEYRVTAADLSDEMLGEAIMNAGTLAEKIEFRLGNAEDLDLPDDMFDVVISRNLTWNLPHPDVAYSEWNRVLRPGGLLVNFDANWYRYLHDDERRAAYEADRAKSESLGLDDQNVGENFDLMEEIALDMPLSRIERPDWDMGILAGLGMDVRTDTEIWRKVWTEQERVNFASTPLFMILAEKSGN